MKPLRDLLRDHIVAQEPVIGLSNGMIADVERGTFHDRGTVVLIKGDRIVGVGPEPALHRYPQVDFRIDLQGQYLLPGLLNTHCHTTWISPPVTNLRSIISGRSHFWAQARKNMLDCLRFGVTTIRDAWSNDLTKLQWLLDAGSEFRWLQPRIIRSVVVDQVGGYFDQEPRLPFRLIKRAAGIPLVNHEKPNAGQLVFRVNASEQEVRDAVNRAIDERGAECIKVAEQEINLVNFKRTLTVIPLPQMTALVDQAAKRGVPVTIHHETAAGLMKAVLSGITSIAHLPFDRLLTEAEIQAFVSNKCIIEPTISVMYAAAWPLSGERPSSGLKFMAGLRVPSYNSLIKEFWLPELQPQGLAYRRLMESDSKRVLGVVDYSTIVAHTNAVLGAGVQNLQRLYAAGALIGCGNDSGVPPLTPGMVGLEYELLMEYLNWETAIKCTSKDIVRMATINSARALGCADEIGSITQGKRADLILVAENPLQDYRVLKHPVSAVILAGRVMSGACELMVKPVS